MNDGRCWRLDDFPVVFLSYDEPWADRNWLDLRSKFPRVVRVHGVKGLDACHKAAAAAVPGDWVVTVDADTRVGASLPHAHVPDRLLTGNFRLDWLSRNVVNGLWTGNGCVKLWPKALIAEMRTHEAAPAGTLSLDHDVASIRSGRSAQVAMPERDAFTDPAATPFHAFRAGLRETAFLRSLAERAARRRGDEAWRTETELVRLIEIWCSVGRQAIYGRWMLYGARMGLVLPDLWADWDLREVNDHDAIRRLWAGRIAPRLQLGNARRADQRAWNWPALEADLARLAQEIAARGGPDLAELDASASGALARTPILATPVSPAHLDALGYRLMLAAHTAEDRAEARTVLEGAAIQGHPAAHFNLATLLDRDERPDPRRVAWHLATAAHLGNEHARNRLGKQAETGRELPEVGSAADLPLVPAPGSRTGPDPDLPPGQVCLVADAGVTLLPHAARHVPDLDLVTEGVVLGYLSLCPMTGLPRPRGVRLARFDRRAAPTAAILPIVLGQLPAPPDAEAALRGGLADPCTDLPPLLATLGRDAVFGSHWVLGSLMARLGRKPTVPVLRRLAKSRPDALDAEIASLARDLAKATGSEVPVWTAAESRALKRMLPAVPGKTAWLEGAAALSTLGPHGNAQGNVLRATARLIWGDGPEAT